MAVFLPSSLIFEPQNVLPRYNCKGEGLLRASLRAEPGVRNRRPLGRRGLRPRHFKRSFYCTGTVTVAEGFL